MQPHLLLLGPGTHRLHADAHLLKVDPPPLLVSSEPMEERQLASPGVQPAAMSSGFDMSLLHRSLGELSL